MWVKDDVQVSDMNHGFGPAISYSSILAYKIPHAKEPGGLPSMGSQKRVVHCLVTKQQETRAFNLRVPFPRLQAIML